MVATFDHYRSFGVRGALVDAAVLFVPAAGNGFFHVHVDRGNWGARIVCAKTLRACREPSTTRDDGVGGACPAHPIG